MSWNIFEEHAPELASHGVDRLHRKIAYLAILYPDGSPRLNPVTLFIGTGMLFMFTEPTSPKIRYLRRDGRYDMHCAVNREDPLVEYLVSGVAREINDPAVREQAENYADSSVVDHTYALFKFMVERVLVVTYDDQKKKLVRRWQTGNLP
jgi:hypothetical protein